MAKETYVPFSERYGYVRKAFQIDSMDAELRNGLWNVFSHHLWEQSTSHNPPPQFRDFVANLWENHFRETSDDLRDKLTHGGLYSSYGVARLHIKERFFNSDWCKVYDFLDFISFHYGQLRHVSKFMESCNEILKREGSAYRFVSGRITPITNEMEIETIESAVEEGGPVAIQLRSALEKLSDRQTPDYRNSIKESISAVESQARRVMRSETTLGRLLNKMEEERGLPTPLKTAFSTFYTYTSGRIGARHGPSEAEEMEVDFDLAKFMLVTCSAFVIYLATLEEPHEADE